MQPGHQIHHTKPKIAKNASSKLPQAFRMQSSVVKKVQKTSQEHKNQSQQKQEQNKQKQQHKKDRKSKNPFLPIKQFMKKQAQFQKEIKQANWNNSDRFSKYSIESDKPKIRYKYQNCLTLNIVKKSTSGCLKKVLHVPTLTVHFLKESLISSHFDKSELNLWIQIINKETSPSMKVLELFWNMPQDYYSLLYEYSEGLLLDSVNQTINTLPSPLLRQIASLHFNSNIGIFNSHIILHQDGANQKIIRYLPIYEQGQYSVSEMPRLKEIIDSQIGPQDNTLISRKFSWRLGLLILNGYFGFTILAQEIPKIQLPFKKCCLFHEILSNSRSVAAPLLQIGYIQDQVADFLCHCLSSKKNVDKNFELSSLKKHRWFSKNYDEYPDSLSDILSVVNPSYTKHSKFELSKMNRILDSVGLILQNISGIELNIGSESRGVIDLAKQLGMLNEIEKVVSELRKIYKSQKN